MADDGEDLGADAAVESESPAAGTPGKRARVRGRVAGLVKGGFEVEIDGETAFCGLGHISLGRVSDPSSFLGRELEFEVLNVPPGATTSPRPRLSRRRLLEEEAREATRAARRRLTSGARVRGRVTRIADFGVFVDVAGVEGLVPLSEISHRRFERASDLLFVGQEVDLVVLRGGGESSGRVAVSIKATEEDPWARASERWPRWQVADGRLVRVTEFGAFFEVEPGIEGLLHASELPPGALEKLEEASRGGALMSVLILGVDTVRRRVSLAAAPRGLEPGQRVEPVALRPGSVVSGRVEDVDATGIVVRFGPGQVGMIPHPEMGTPRGTDHRAEFPRGSEIEAEVVRVEGGGRRAQLSRKRAIRRAERAEVERYSREQSIGSLSTFGDLLAQAREKKKR